MRNLGKIKLDGKKRRIYFLGSCAEVIKLCQAACCREWNVCLTEKEFNSALYRSEGICKLEKNACYNPRASCFNRGYRLKKRRDSSCIYLTSENKCRIYKKRPGICRDFSCREGWKIAVPSGPDNIKIPKTAKAGFFTDKHLSEEFKPDMFFMLNPLVKIKGIFPAKGKNNIVFLLKRINSCSLRLSTFKSGGSAIKKMALSDLVNLFNGKNNLGAIYQKSGQKHYPKPTWKVFLRIADFLLVNNIIVFKKT